MNKYYAGIAYGHKINLEDLMERYEKSLKKKELAYYMGVVSYVINLDEINGIFCGKNAAEVCSEIDGCDTNILPLNNFGDFKHYKKFKKAIKKDETFQLTEIIFKQLYPEREDEKPQFYVYMRTEV